MNRRGFLTAATAFLASPALVRASSLDYVPRAAPDYILEWDISSAPSKTAIACLFKNGSTAWSYPGESFDAFIERTGKEGNVYKIPAANFNLTSPLLYSPYQRLSIG